MAKIEAYNVAGEKQTIPEHWLGLSHPAFDFTKTPRRSAKETTKPAKPEAKEAK